MPNRLTPSSNATQRILTGIQSTGIPHLGNILGAIRPALQASQQRRHSALFFIADLHTLTSQRDPQAIRRWTYATAAAWLACGLDPQKDLLYRQSRIPEVCELAWFLNCYTPYAMLANAHAFKEKSKNLSQVKVGLFTYPVLMAADILLYQATHIPVGKDQKQHIEITRDIAQAVNREHPGLFTLPQAKIKTNIATIPGTDGRKMSKSYQNTLNIFAHKEEIEKTIKKIKTDSKPLADPKDPDQCLLFQLYRYIATQEQVATMANRYQAGGYGYQSAKKELLEAILTRFSAERERFDYYLAHPEHLEEILQAGEAKARAIAQPYIAKIRQAIGVANS